MIPIIGAKPKWTAKTWSVQVVIECECGRTLLLHDGPVTCPSCGLAHQFASFDYQGEPLVPAQLGLRVVTFLPKPAS